MDPRKLQRIVVDALEDIKAQEIRVFNTSDQTELFDRVIIATGTSNRQTRALAAHVRDKAREAGGHVVSMEGADTGEWVLVDLGDIIVHVMQPAIRAYYNLEELWGRKPVRLRAAATGTAGAAPTSNGARAAKTTPARSAAKKAPAKPARKSTTSAGSSAAARDSGRAGVRTRKRASA